MGRVEESGATRDPAGRTSGAAGSSTTATTVSDLLNDAPTSAFHHRAAVISGMGFFTDAYDLFVISTVATLVAAQWRLSTTETSWVTGSTILAACIGALVFGRVADVVGRKTIYTVVAGIMIVGALVSAVAPNVGVLIGARFVLGLGIGGDYPVSAVLMSEYANRRDRGRLVGLVFSMQALGLIVGPLVALVLLATGAGNEATWRILLGLGALPAAAVIYLRAKMPESPRFQARVRGDWQRASAELGAFARGAITGDATTHEGAARLTFREFLTHRRMRALVVGTAGSWFLFDYAYYGNTLSLPNILHDVDPAASLEAKLAWSLAIFVAFALPGYLLAVARMDRIGHRKLQLVGFGVMALSFLVLAAVPALSAATIPFILIFGVSYFFTEFGPNTSTFVLPSEVFPDEMRATGHGIAAGVGKLGAFIGVFAVPQLSSHLGLRGMLFVAGGAAIAGLLCTLLLPEPAQLSLEDLAASHLGEQPDAD